MGTQGRAQLVVGEAAHPGACLVDFSGDFIPGEVGRKIEDRERRGRDRDPVDSSKLAKAEVADRGNANSGQRSTSPAHHQHFDVLGCLDRQLPELRRRCSGQ
jgi:hypothetical protein